MRQCVIIKGDLYFIDTSKSKTIVRNKMSALKLQNLKVYQDTDIQLIDTGKFLALNGTIKG
jgi:hypothetical protein